MNPIAIITKPNAPNAPTAEVTEKPVQGRCTIM